MSGIPLELLTLLGSSGLSSLIKLASRFFEARRFERTYVLEALSARRGLIDDARRFENQGFAWTRRVIALIASFFIIAFPKLVAVYLPEISVHVSYTEMTGGFWFFSDGRPEVIWRDMKGLVITPLDTHLLAAIIGLYFGGSLVK